MVIQIIIVMITL